MCQIGHESVLEFTFIYLGGGGYPSLKTTDKHTDHEIVFTTIQCHVQHLHLYLVYNQYLLDLESFHLRYLIAGKITRVLTFRLDCISLTS